MAVPSSLLLRFFRDATDDLDRHPAPPTLSEPLMDDESSSGAGDPPRRRPRPPVVGLRAHRRLLLAVQLEALERAVSDHNKSSREDGRNDQDDDGEWAAVTMEAAQSALRRLGGAGGGRRGGDDDGPEDDDENDDDEVSREELTSAMAAMNDAARLAFARAVLRSESDWDEYRASRLAGNDDDDDDDEGGARDLRTGGDGRGPMGRDDVVEFCALTSAAVRLPEVKEHLRSGAPLFPDATGVGDAKDADGRGSAAAAPEPASAGSIPALPPEGGFLPPQLRMERIQRLVLRAVGYDPDFGASEIRRIYFGNDDSEGGDLPPAAAEYADDHAMHDAFAKLTSDISVAVTNASLNAPTGVVATDGGGRPASDGAGGVGDGDATTRIVSVTYSEREVADPRGGGFGAAPSAVGAPTGEAMEEHAEALQKQQLRVAKEAAEMQRQIIDNLRSMPEEERERTLRAAKDAHETFVADATRLPPGPERVEYLRNIDPNVQRLLAMHKIWEGTAEAERRPGGGGAVPPSAQGS